MLTVVSERKSKILSPLSFGIGDRFGQQGSSQLRAFEELARRDIHVTPVWNKSHREHRTVGSVPFSVMQEATETVGKLQWTHEWHVDADHITFSTVDAYIPHADFFTIDVAAQINEALDATSQKEFLARYGDLEGEVLIEGIDTPFYITRDDLMAFGDRYWMAARQAGKIYRHIAGKKDTFIAEVSMDEVDLPQKPVELLVILRLLASEGVMLQTIAPKFSGRFNKGVDYEGDLKVFAREFEQDLLVIRYAIRHYGLPESLKLSVHTGSDKFSLYPVIKQLIRKYDTGIHVKTAGTTWLAEAIGLALSGGQGLALVKNIYREAFDRTDELITPYASVLNIDRQKLPEPAAFDLFNEDEVAETLRHEPGNAMYNPHVRQLMHTAYKVAAEKEQLIPLLRENNVLVGLEVFNNLFERHLTPLFL